MSRKIQSPFTVLQRLQRLLWSVAWSVLHCPFPRTCFAGRRVLLRLFGAKIDSTARVYGTAKIWAPWNLVMKANSILADDVDCYNVDRVTLEEGAIVSQYAFLCTASHDVHDPNFPLVTAPIMIKRGAWVAAKAVVGMGVAVGENAVVALGAVVVKDVAAGVIAGGNPAREIGRRDTA